MEWEKFIKRYVWDEDKTPYLVPVNKLTQRQAGYELKAYTIFLGCLFAVVAVASLSGQIPQGRSVGVSLYAFTVVCSSVILGFTAHYFAALYCGASPVAAFGYFYVYGFHPSLGLIDHVVILVILLMGACYSLRVVAISKHYPTMPRVDAGGS